ncbi:MAG: hypothetical protein ACRDPO_07500 [Streptosporangiaceae bacterium]
MRTTTTPAGVAPCSIPPWGLSLIHTDPGRAWTLDTLARSTQTPRATLTRRFAALTGQSPVAYRKLTKTTG